MTTDKQAAFDAIETFVNDYVASYALDDSECYHEPTEHERFLIEDAINGLVADEGFVSLMTAAVAAERDALLTENAALASWQCIHQDGKTGLTHDDRGSASCAQDAGPWRELVWAIGRALNCLPSTAPDGNAHILKAAMAAGPLLKASKRVPVQREEPIGVTPRGGLGIPLYVRTTTHAAVQPCTPFRPEMWPEVDGDPPDGGDVPIIEQCRAFRLRGESSDD